jgi:hypothetical protein
MRRAEQHPELAGPGRGLDIARGRGQALPIKGRDVGDIDACIAGESAFGKMHEIGALIRGLVDLLQNPAAIVADVRFHSELARRHAQGFHGGSSPRV